MPHAKYNGCPNKYTNNKRHTCIWNFILYNCSGHFAVEFKLLVKCHQTIELNWTKKQKGIESVNENVNRNKYYKADD